MKNWWNTALEYIASSRYNEIFEFITSDIYPFRLPSPLQEYKPPTALDIPVDFRVTLLPNAKNPHGVLGAKGREAAIGWLRCSQL